MTGRPDSSGELLRRPWASALLFRREMDLRGGAAAPLYSFIKMGIWVRSGGNAAVRPGDSNLVFKDWGTFQDDGDRPVVFDLDEHVRAEFARLARNTLALQ